jgi:uncharacterized membrane protein YqhA
MKKTKVISYIHLLGCIGWSVFGFVDLVYLITEDAWMIDALVILLYCALFATTASGIYLFVVRRNKRLESIKNPNTIMTIVISYIHLLGCIGWSVFGFVGLIENFIWRMDAKEILAFCAIFATTASGIYLFVVRKYDLSV